MEDGSMSGQENRFDLAGWAQKQRVLDVMREVLAEFLVRLAEPLEDGETSADRENRARAANWGSTGFEFDPEAGEWTAWALCGPEGDAERLVVRSSDLRRNEKLEKALRDAPAWELGAPGDDQ
jgi:hypothetical protein